MTAEFVGLLVLYLAVLLAIAPLLGRYIRIAMENGQSRLTAWGRPLERGIYRLAGIDPQAEMGWKRYTLAVLAFNILGIMVVYGLQRLQGMLPLNPAGMGAVTPDSALNTAISFVANTNWQGYGGESTMSYLTQMLALTVQNFVSAATGIAVLFALIRGLARHCSATVGNFWADMVRCTLYVLLPLSFVLALALVSQGVIQNFSPYQDVQTVEALHYDQPRVDAQGQPVLDAKGQPVTDPAVTSTQTLAMGPVASQEAIKLLGTNGGGFFNANSAHPFENPSAVTNLVQMLSIFTLGVGLTWTFGKAVGNTRQGWAILSAMAILFVAGAALAYGMEAHGSPTLQALGLSGGNMEGKEVRFGIVGSALFAAVTTAASCGAVNAMHDSFTALGGLVPLFNMQLGEVIVGGVGAGIYGFLLFAILAVFVAGLMVGRTPEYVGKKIEAREVKLAVLAIAVLPLMILGGTAIASVTQAGLAGPLNKGPHGFSEILYAFTSAAANNGSAFAGLTAGTPFYNGLLSVGMWLGRFFVIVPVLAIAGSLAAKKHTPATAGSFPTTGPLWVGLLVGIILILGGLTFLPSLALGPVADHIATLHGQLN